MSKRNTAAAKVSVVVAVYNAMPYLPQCLDSIVGQSLRELEIICVNDGSTDDSLDVLNEYAARDSRLRVISKENEGLGAASARNLGLKNAGCEHVIILDSDDFFEPEMLKEMLERAEHTVADIVLCDCFLYDNRTNFNYKANQNRFDKLVPDKETFSYKDIPNDIYQISPGMLWNKLYRIGFLQRHKLGFQNIKYTDDVFFVFAHMALAEKIAVVNKPFIHYRINTGGAQTDGLTNCPDSAYLPYIELRKLLIERGIYEAVKRSFVNCAAAFLRFFHDRLDKFEVFKYLHDMYREKIFAELDISGHESDYFYDKRVYLWQKSVSANTAEEMLFKTARVYGEGMTTAALRFEFPYHLVEPGDRLAIYGAGLVGKYYLGQLLLTRYCSVSLWIDDLENDGATPDEAEDYHKGLAYSARLTNVPSDILSARYDKVFIALADKAARERAKQRLLALGVPAERIICEDI